MASDIETGTLLRVLAASKPAARALELGTGTGLSTAWILDGLDADSTLVTVDSDEQVVEIARRHLGSDTRVSFRVDDGEQLLDELVDQRFALIFADTWPGKFRCLEKALRLLEPGGLYVVDDLLPQDSWPAEHAAKVPKFIAQLESYDDLQLVQLDWSTGILVAAKRAVGARV